MGTPTVESLQTGELPSAAASLEAGAQNVSKWLRRELLPDPGCSGLFFRNREDARLSPLRCHTLSCPTCGPGVLWGVAEAIREAVEVHGLDHLITLTMPGRTYKGRGDPIASRRDLLRGWNRVRTGLRQAGYLGAFVSLVEYQRDGTAHLHVGTQGRVPWDLVNRLAWKAGLGFVWVSGPEKRRGRGPRIGGPAELASYLAKYLTKSARALQAGEVPLGATYYCLEDGRMRKAPLRTYTASRAVGRTIAEARTRFRGALDVEGLWEVVSLWVNHVGEPQETVVIRRPTFRLPDCPSHLEKNGWAPCLGTPRKRWGPPLTAYAALMGGTYHGETFPVDASPQPASGWSRGPETPAARAERGSEPRGAPSSLRRCHACGRPPVVTFRGRAYCWDCWLDLPEKGLDPGENVDAEAPPRAKKTGWFKVDQ